ncbi:MAG: YdbL family protein [Rhodospirillaceae bacterium]|jgi:uncharacterized protein|nr:YdbL family protein [Rhodospirillaceae bacterium]
MSRSMHWIKSRVMIAALFGAFLFAGAFVGAAQAGELDAAMRSGAVGETARGYVAVVSGANAAVTKLVNDINAKRRDKYRTLAKKHNTPLSQIETVVGKRLTERAPAGVYVQDSSGAWRRK